MNPQQIRRVSRTLSWLLRHGAREAGLAMDEAGWAAIDDVLAELRIDRATLEQVAAQNDKQRLQLRDGRVRACQGHSLDGTPVTAEALERTWADYERPGHVFHGTGLDVLDAIALDGIVPAARTHVHLAATTTSRVGKRYKVQVLLAVDTAALRADGHGLWSAPNGVILARRIPPAYVVGAIPQSRKALRAQAAGHGPFKWFGHPAALPASRAGAEPGGVG